MSKTLKAKGFTSSLADPDFWMHLNTEPHLWEYVCVYVDNLAIAMINPQELLDKLQ